MAYGLERGLLYLVRAKSLENRGRRNRGEMTWGRNDRLPSGVLLLSTNQGNGKKIRITVVLLAFYSFYFKTGLRSQSIFCYVEFTQRFQQLSLHKSSVSKLAKCMVSFDMPLITPLQLQ